MSVQDRVYSTAWGGLRRSLITMARRMDGTEDFLTAKGSVEAYLDVLDSLLLGKSRTEILTTTVSGLSREDQDQLAKRLTIA